MGSRATRVMGFLPANFQLRTPIRQAGTDRWTDGRHTTVHNAPTMGIISKFGTLYHSSPLLMFVNVVWRSLWCFCVQCLCSLSTSLHS